MICSNAADGTTVAGEPTTALRRGRWLPRLPHRVARATAGLLALLALLGTLACASSSPEGPGRSPESLTNIFLGPQYSAWLVGPIARMASAEEIDAYLALRDDFAAADAIEAFWRRRDPDPDVPGNPVRELYEERAVRADQSFTEAGFSGRRTARGTIYVLYGEPDETTYEIDPVDNRPFEVWRYTDAEPGLDGRVPTVYRFQKNGDVTTFYRPRAPGSTVRRPPGLGRPGG